MTQLSLLDAATKAERPWKRVRQTSRAAYRDVRERDTAKAESGRETREGQVLRLLAAHWNATQTSPTALELLAWARGRGERLFDANSVRPRITKLVDLGLVESAGQRRCEQSGKVAHTWRVAQR